jgi:phosphoribosylanthranilate isomerase
VSRAAVKICGITRASDAAAAVAGGARYVGTILAGGPRLVTPVHARAVFDAARGATRVVIVGHEPPEDIVQHAMTAGADIVQLHGDPSPASVAALRERWPGGIWAAMRLASADLDIARAKALFAAADGVVLDAHAPNALGGTGVTLDWRALAPALDEVRADDACDALLVLAGGLRPENVWTAVQLVRPDVVDVSSGVEVSPGVKDLSRVQRFIAAAHGSPSDGEQLSLPGVPA